MKCNKWLHIYGNKLGTGVNREWVDDVRENVRGEWIFPYGDKKYKRCSSCGKTFYSIPSTSNFCPNCGADMRGES